MRTVVGYHRYDTETEVLPVNKIWLLQSKIANFSLPQQKPIPRSATGSKITKKHDVPTTPSRRAERHAAVSLEDKTIMNDMLAELNPAAIQRQIQALIAGLPTLTTSKAAALNKPPVKAISTRASGHESTTTATCAS